MVTTKLNLSMTEPQVRQIYAKQGDTGRVLDITLDQTPEDGTLRILRPDGTEVTSEAVTGGEVESGSTFESLTEADVTELTVGIEPVQDLNGYDAPWVGGAGTNKYDDSAKTNAFIDDQGAEITGDTWYLSDYCAIPLGTTKVTLSWQSERNYYQGRVVAYDSSKTFISGSFVSWAGTAQSHTFDVPSTASYVRVNYSHVVGSQESPRNNVRLNVGTSDLGYSPYSNICPIAGHDEVRVTRTGKNLLETNDVTVQGGTFVADNDGWISAVNTTSDPRIWEYASSQWYLTLKQGTYAFKVEADDTWASQANRGVQIFTEQNNQLLSTGTAGDYTFTLPKQTTIGVMTKIYAGKVRLQIELGSTATAYEPYQGSTYTTSLGQTVYGGTLDMVTGVLTVDKAMVTFLWSNGYAGASLGSVTRKGFALTEYVDMERGSEAISDLAPYDANSWAGDFVHFDVGGAQGRQAFVWLPNETADSQTITIVYPLATPQTYQLTPQQIKTLVGTNNVWASSGDIVNIKFTYGGLLSELPSEATEIVGKCYCDVEQNGVSSMPFTLNVKKNERES